MHPAVERLLDHMRTHPHQFTRVAQSHDQWVSLFRRYRRFLDRESKSAILESYRLIQLAEMADQIDRQIRAAAPGFAADESDRKLAKEVQEQLIGQLKLVELEGVSAPSLYQWMQKTPLWSIYEKRFKKYRALSHFLNYLLGLANTASARFASGKRRKIISLAEYCDNQNRVSLLAGGRVETPPPETNPRHKRRVMIAPHLDYSAPAIYAATIGNATVVGGTNIIFKESLAICHDLYNFQLDSTSEELHGHHFVDPKALTLRWVNANAYPPSEVSQAATFLDACAPNYAHWLTEVLPRIAALTIDKRYEKTSILVDSHLHENLVESLALVCRDREVIFVPPRKPLLVRELVVTSVAGYVPWGRRVTSNSGHSHGIFNPNGLLNLVRVMQADQCDKPKKQWPRHVYIRRLGGGRKLLNEDELLAIVERKGFAVVCPEKLTFLEQVALFSNADHIVGVTGAAMANLIFTKPTCHVDILMPEVPDTSYWYWQNIACAVGKTVRYTLGRPVNLHAGIHADFEIESKYLKTLLN